MGQPPELDGDDDGGGDWVDVEDGRPADSLPNLFLVDSSCFGLFLMVPVDGSKLSISFGSSQSSLPALSLSTTDHKAKMNTVFSISEASQALN